jgi:hypothetical protein
MPNAIRNSNSIPINGFTKPASITSGYYISLAPDGGVGPTPTTGWYSGITPQSGKYVVYYNTFSNPLIYAPQSDAELIRLANSFGFSVSTVDDALSSFASNNGYFVANFNYENIVTNGLVLNLDAGFVSSYPRSGVNWYDLSGNANHGTLINGPTFDPANSGSIVWDGVDDYADTGKTATQLGFYDANYTMEAWVYPTSLTNDRTMFGTDQTALRQGLHLVFRNGTIYQGHYASDFSAGTVTVNNWYQIVYTYNASNGACQIFKNGVSQGTGTISSFIGTTNILIARWAGTYNFQGNGGIYRIYNRVLTQAEVTQNYNAQKGRYGL